MKGKVSHLLGTEIDQKKITQFIRYLSSLELLFLLMHFAVKREKKGRVRPWGTRFTLLWRHRTQHYWALFEKESKMAPETRETMQSSQFPEQKKRWGEGGERHPQGEEEVMESMEQKYRPRKEGQVSEREGSLRKGCNQILDSV